MKIKVQKNIAVDVEIDLSQPLFLSESDKIIRRVTKAGDGVQLLYACNVTIGCVSIDTRHYLNDCDLDAIMGMNGAKKISPGEFYKILSKWMRSENILQPLTENIADSSEETTIEQPGKVTA